MAARKGRPPKPPGSPQVRLSDAHRDKIAKANILNHLIEHVGGTRDMTTTQVTAGLGLLKKCLPDLSNVTVSGDEENPLKVIGEMRLVGVRPGGD